MKKKNLKDFKEAFEKSPEGVLQVSAKAKIAKDILSRKRNYKLKAPVESIKVAIFGDTHFGSKYEDLDALNMYAEICRKENVSAAFHAGDVLEGHDLYRGQIFEVEHLGWNAQSKHFGKVAPDFGCPVYFITGNHDVSFKRAGGIAVGQELEQLRSDWICLGEDSGDFEFDIEGKKIKISMLHPGGGSSYALSYRPQKIVEALEGGTKPHILCIGNYHKSDWLPSYRNVSVLQVGCFQRQTPFMKTKGLSAMVGGWILEFGFGEGCSRQKAEFIPFY